MHRQLSSEELYALNHRYWIYFITTKEEGGPIKIGWAISPDKRFDKIQACSPYPLRMLGYMPGSTDDEAALHKYFAPYRLHGEWFSGEIVSEVRELLQQNVKQ